MCCCWPHGCSATRCAGRPSTARVRQLRVRRARRQREALRRLLALADAAGALRIGAFELSAEQEATLDLFVEQTVGPYLGTAIQLAFEVGTNAGLPPRPWCSSSTNPARWPARSRRSPTSASTDPSRGTGSPRSSAGSSAHWSWTTVPAARPLRRRPRRHPRRRVRRSAATGARRGVSDDAFDRRASPAATTRCRRPRSACGPRSAPATATVTRPATRPAQLARGRCGPPSPG